MRDLSRSRAFLLTVALLGSCQGHGAGDGQSSTPAPQEPPVDAGPRPAPARGGDSTIAPAASPDAPAALGTDSATDRNGSAPPAGDTGPGGDTAAPVATGPMNVIVILVDDLGWADLGGYGSTFHETPALDRLAREGVKFTHAYSASPVCSPSRAALLTGRAPARIKVTDWIPGYSFPNTKLLPPSWTKQMPTEEITVAEALKEAGYVTGLVGKWHLGDLLPERHGFDVNVGGTKEGRATKYFPPYDIPNLPDGPAGEYLTDRLGAEANKFIEANRARPFFLFMPHFAVHEPIVGRPDLVAKYRAKMKPGLTHNNPQYAAMLESIDTSLAAMVAKLEQLQLTRKTVIIFTSDNGGWMPTTSNAPLRAEKGTQYEGGLRVPLIVSWPGVVKPGLVIETPVIGMDIFPTTLELAGATPPAGRPLDGHSLVPLLRDGRAPTRDALFWHYPHYHIEGATPFGAIRKGDLKLVEYFEDGKLELFDVRADVAEARNLAAAMPAKAMELRAELDAWRKAVGAQMPRPR